MKMAPNSTLRWLSILSISLFILFFSSSLATARLHNSHMFLHSFQALQLPSAGPESLAFDPKGNGPYTGVLDGRVLKYTKRGWADFAITSPNRTKEFCDGRTDSSEEHTCGRPLGLEFYHKTGDLYLLDSVRGLMVVGPKGGLATQLAPGHPDLAGVPGNLPDGLDVDQITGDVYFTYAGPGFLAGNFSGGNTGGRLFKYDRRTRSISIALDNLGGPLGNAVSKDGTYVVITEFVNTRVIKLWIKGPKAGTSEVIFNITGTPDNIKRTECGDFWIASTVRNSEGTNQFGYKIDGDGRLLRTLNFKAEYGDTGISEVHEHRRSFYVGSGDAPFVAKYEDGIASM